MISPKQRELVESNPPVQWHEQREPQNEPVDISPLAIVHVRLGSLNG